MSDSNAGMREALREAYKEGDIDLEEYLMEMKKLRAQQSVEAGEEAAAAAESEEEEDDVLLVDEDGGLFADGDAQQQGSSELSPGSAGRSPLARASEPEESADEEEDLVDLGSDDEDGEDGEDGQGAPSPQQTQAPEQQLRAGPASWQSAVRRAASSSAWCGSGQQQTTSTPTTCTSPGRPSRGAASGPTRRTTAG